MENILPNGCCFADVMTKKCQAFLSIPLVLCILHSPFHSNDDVIIIHSFNDNKFAIGIIEYVQVEGVNASTLLVNG